MKIGLPSALLHPYYRTFWSTFFSELGLEVVESGLTTKEIVNKGVRRSVPEICVPMKIYTGHVVELLDQKVDKIYIPRFVSIRKQDSFCPKFLGLPDMLRATVNGLEEKLITHHLVSETDDIATPQNYLPVGQMFTDDVKLIRKALAKGHEKWQNFRNLCCLDGLDCQAANEAVLFNQKVEVKPQPVKIGLIGYVYNVYDPMISMEVLKKLQQLGAQAVTFEMLKNSTLEKQMHHISRRLFWTFTNKLLASAYHFFEDDKIDGVIHLTAFGCGPDAFLGKILELDSNRYEKPLMTIRVDEHTGENHLQTRLEAFVDMLAKQKREKGCA